MNWLKNILRSLSSKKRITNSNSKKTFDEIYDDLGAFQYNEEGFTISYEGFAERIRWTDITQLNVFKKDLFTVDEICMEIVCSEQTITISEELPGWYQFVLKTKEIFPTIPKDWNFTITQPPMTTNYRTIYDRPNDAQ